MLILGKVKQLESRGAADVIIVDAPAAGHAITFLSSAQGMLDAVTVGPIEAQAREVRNLLTDASRCQVVLVTLPEETPVNEVIETAYSLEDRIGIKLGPVVVNGIYPDLPGLDQSPTAAANAEEVELSTELAAALEAAATFRRDRQDLQRHQLSRLAKDLPLDQVRLPFVFRSDLGLDSLRALSESLVEQLGRLDAVGSPS